MSGGPPTNKSRGIVQLTPGPQPGSHDGQAFESGRIRLPVVIVSALEAAGTGVHRFLARLVHGSIWQDQSIRSADREVDIQAYLAPDELRCVIRIGRSIFYHHPLGTFHVFGMPRPDICVGDGLPLRSILPHELLDTIPITVTGIASLNTSRPDLGICIRVTMPATDVAIPADHG